MNPIEVAGRTLAAARTGAPLDGLPEPLRPRDLPQAEAIQHATLAALGEAIGGWKVGRHGGHAFSAPFPASLVVEDAGALAAVLPTASLIELEIAIRFHTAVAPAGIAALRPEDLPGLASIATLFEFVQQRFAPSATTGPLDRIAECMANNGAALRPGPDGWTLAMLDAPPATRLSRDGEQLARHDGPHVAAPVRPLIEAWLARLVRDGLGITAGQALTFGSLTGMLPIPPGDHAYLGEIDGLPPLRCAVTLPG